MRQQLGKENETLKRQVDVLKKEYYNLEAQHRESRANERAEIVSLRDQLQGYVQVERELESAIRACAEGPSSGAVEIVGVSDAPKTVDEALLLGTTLASTPSSAKRRIQQSLILAQELQRRSREAAQARHALVEAESEVARLTEERDAARREAHYSSEPQAYLLEGLRRREAEALSLKRELRSRDQELERSRQQAEHAVADKLRVETDLKRLLAQRRHLDGLKVLLGCDDGVGVTGSVSGIAVASFAPPRHEHRGRAPSQGGVAPQQPVWARFAGASGAVVAGATADLNRDSPKGAALTTADVTELSKDSVPGGADFQLSGGPAWFQRLKSRTQPLQ